MSTPGVTVTPTGVVIVPPSVVLTRKNNSAEDNVVTTVVDGRTTVVTRNEYFTSTLSDGVVVVLQSQTSLVTDVATYTFTESNGDIGVETVTLTSFDIITVCDGDLESLDNHNFHDQQHEHGAVVFPNLQRRDHLAVEHWLVFYVCLGNDKQLDEYEQLGGNKRRMPIDLLTPLQKLFIVRHFYFILQRLANQLERDHHVASDLDRRTNANFELQLVVFVRSHDLHYLRLPFRLCASPVHPGKPSAWLHGHLDLKLEQLLFPARSTSSSSSSVTTCIASGVPQGCVPPPCTQTGLINLPLGCTVTGTSTSRAHGNYQLLVVLILGHHLHTWSASWLRASTLHVNRPHQPADRLHRDQLVDDCFPDDDILVVVKHPYSLNRDDHVPAGHDRRADGNYQLPPARLHGHLDLDVQQLFLVKHANPLKRDYHLTADHDR
ncbi:hypothetical protein JCM10207_008717 [Rhodosporidiobolus poonsookiae]